MFIQPSLQCFSFSRRFSEIKLTSDVDTYWIDISNVKVLKISKNVANHCLILDGKETLKMLTDNLGGHAHVGILPN